MILVDPAVAFVTTLLTVAYVIGSFIIMFKNEEKGLTKVLWTLIFICLPIIGSTIYYINYFVNKSNKSAVLN